MIRASIVRVRDEGDPSVLRRPRKPESFFATRRQLIRETCTVIGGITGGLVRGALSWLLLAEGIDRGHAARGLWSLEVAVVQGAIVGALGGALAGWLAGLAWQWGYQWWRHRHPPRYS